MSARSALWALGPVMVGATWVVLAVGTAPPRVSEVRTDGGGAETRPAAPRPSTLAAAYRAPLAPTACPEAPTSARETDPDEDTERAHHAAFVALAARDPDALGARAADVLRGEGPSCRKVALLRALLDTGSPALGDACALAVRELPLESDERGVSLPEFAVRLLGENAAGRSELSDVLHGVVWGRARAPDRGLRSRAARLLVAAAGPRELERIARELRADPDPDLLRVAASEMTKRTSEPNIAYLLVDLDLPPPAPVEEE